MQERAFKLIAQVLDAVKMPRRVAHTSAHCDQVGRRCRSAHRQRVRRFMSQFKALGGCTLITCHYGMWSGMARSRHSCQAAGSPLWAWHVTLSMQFLLPHIS